MGGLIWLFGDCLRNFLINLIPSMFCQPCSSISLEKGDVVDKKKRAANILHMVDGDVTLHTLSLTGPFSIIVTHQIPNILLFVNP